MSRKRSDPLPGPTWGQRTRLRSEAEMLARIVLDAGAELDAVLGDEAIDEAAETIHVDADDLRRAIEAEIERGRRT